MALSSRAVSTLACWLHEFSAAGASRWHAYLEVLGQPLPYVRGEPPARRQAFRVSHRLPRFFPQACSSGCLSRGNSDDFVFDNQILAQILWSGLRDWGSDVPGKYMPEASSINFRRSVRYGFGCREQPQCVSVWPAGAWLNRLFRYWSTRSSARSISSRDVMAVDPYSLAV